MVHGQSIQRAHANAILHVVRAPCHELPSKDRLVGCGRGLLLVCIQPWRMNKRVGWGLVELGLGWGWVGLGCGWGCVT
jgi:hypothetical protein